MKAPQKLHQKKLCIILLKKSSEQAMQAIDEALLDAMVLLLQYAAIFGTGGNGEAVAVNRVSTSSGTRGGGVSYLGKDILGSVRSSSTQNAALENRYEYDAFGKPYSGDFSSGMSLGYTGKPYDSATGLYNYGYRDYAPQQARFTTVDPVRDGSNWMAYVNNDPINWLDLFGLYCVGSDSQAKVDALGTKPYRPLSDDIKDDLQNSRGWVFVGDNPKNEEYHVPEDDIKRYAEATDYTIAAKERGYDYLITPTDPTKPHRPVGTMGTQYTVTNVETNEVRLYAHDINNDSWIDYVYEPRRK